MEVKMNDTIQAVADSLAISLNSASSSAEGHTNWWMITSIIELLIILFLLVRNKGQESEKSRIKKMVMSEGDIDFGNIMNSSFNAEKLYKELIIKCHPDRFAPNIEQVAIANDLSARIGKNKNDIKQLEKLKEEAIEKLNINF